MRSRTVGALALVIGSAVPVLVHAPQADAVTSQQAISVKDAAGHPLAGATVAVTGALTQTVGTTDTTGVAVLDLNAGAGYEVSAAKPGYSVGVESNVTFPPSAAISITLSPTTANLSTLPVFGGRISTILSDGAGGGVFYAATSVVPQLFRTVNYGGFWSPVSISLDDAAKGLTATQPIGRPAGMTTSAVSGEIAAIVGGKIRYSTNFGNSWTTLDGAAVDTGDANDPHLEWLNNGTIDLLQVYGSTSGVQTADLNDLTPTLSAANAPPAGPTDAAIANERAYRARLDRNTGAVTLERLDAAGVASVYPGPVALGAIGATEIHLGGGVGTSSGHTTVPSTLAASSGTNLYLAAKIDNSDGGWTVNAPLDLSTAGCGLPGSGSVPITIDPASVQDSVRVVVGQCMVLWDVSHSAGQAEVIANINSNGGFAWDSSLTVALATDGAFGVLKSTQAKSSGLGVPLFPLDHDASAGTGSTADGISVTGMTAAVVRGSVYGPGSGNTRIATAISPTGGNVGVASDNGGDSFSTVVEKGATSVDWWSAASGDWLLFGHAGSGALLTAVKNWTTSSPSATPTLVNPNVPGSDKGAFGGSVDTVTALEGVDGTDMFFAGMGGGAANKIVRATLSAGPPVGLTMNANWAAAGTIADLHYCPTAGSAAAVQDSLIVAMGAPSPGLVRYAHASGSSPVPTSYGLPGAGAADVAAVEVDCVTGTIWAGTHSNIGGQNGKVFTNRGGSTFVDVTPSTGPAQGRAVTAMTMAAANPNELIFAANREGYLAQTIDAGVTWTTINDPNIGGRYFGSDGVSALDRGTVGSFAGASARFGAAASTAPLQVGAGNGLFAGQFISNAPDLTTSKFVPLSPQRILDTREGVGAPKAKVEAGTSIDLAVLDHGGIPATGVRAVALNITATQASGPGYITVWPAGETRPEVSNLNLAPGDTVPNMVVVPVGAGGKVSLFSYAGTHLIADVAGYFAPSGARSDGRLIGLTPTRILDTRIGIGAPATKPAPDSSLELSVLGQGGLPASGVSAVVLNVTATEATGAGYITVWPHGQDRPLASNLNVVAGQTIANLVIAPVGPGGKVDLYTLGGTHLIADVLGYITDNTVGAGSNGLFVPLSPKRIFDTRTATGIDTTTPIAPDHEVTINLLGRGGLPQSGVGSVLMNVTSTETINDGYVTAYPAGETRPTASNLNVVAGQTLPNLVAVSTGQATQVTLYDYAGGHLIVDVAGFFTT